MTAVAAVLVATEAQAHQVVPGVGGFPGLMLHPIALAHQLACLVTAGLVVARSRPAMLMPSMLAFGAALFAAQAARAAMPAIVAGYWLVALAAIVIAAIAAALLPRMPDWIAVGTTAVLGAVVGLDTMGEGPSLSQRLEAGLASAAAGAIVIAAIGGALSGRAQEWVEIGVRVVAAWVAAAAVMVLAFGLRG